MGTIGLRDRTGVLGGDGVDRVESSLDVEIGTRREVEVERRCRRLLTVKA